MDQLAPDMQSVAIAEQKPTNEPTPSPSNQPPDITIAKSPPSGERISISEKNISIQDNLSNIVGIQKTFKKEGDLMFKISLSLVTLSLIALGVYLIVQNKLIQF